MDISSQRDNKGMRDIIFRAKQVDTGEWRYGSLALIAYSDTYIVDRRRRLVPVDDPEKWGGSSHLFAEPEVFTVRRETVGEFTGLVDQNGRQVFEGDYCCLTRFAVLAYGIIAFRNGCFWFVETAIYEEGKRNCVRLCDLDVNGFKIEVKGNIHDNPKLAEVGL